MSNHGFIPRIQEPVFIVTLRHAESLAVIGEERSVNWKAVVLRVYNASIDSKNRQSRRKNSINSRAKNYY